MHHPATKTLAAQLAALLPPHAQVHAGPCAQMMMAVAAGSALPEVLQAYMAEHVVAAVSTVQALAGHTVAAGGTVMSFGSGNNFGEVTIGNVVGGNQVSVTINLFSPGAPLANGHPDPVKQAILVSMAHITSNGTHCSISDIAQSTGYSAEVVSDEV